VGNPVVPPTPSQYTVGVSVTPDSSGAFRVRVVRPGSAADAAGRVAQNTRFTRMSMMLSDVLKPSLAVFRERVQM